MDERLQKKIYNDEDLAVESFKCKNCGGETVYDAKQKKLRCLYCDSLFEIEKTATAQEHDLQELLSNGQIWKDADVYQCQSCGAKEILQAGEISVVCPFCGTNSIVKTEEIPGLKPQGVSPFMFDKKQAATIAEKWARKKFYAPRKFKKSVKAEKLHGIYNPVFTFDAKTDSIYSGRLGKTYYITRYRNGRPYTVSRTRYFNIKGSTRVDFDDMLVQASSSMPMSIIKSLEPFTTKEVPAFQEEYLRGYSASTYNKEGSQCWEECMQMMKEGIERKILSQYDYNVKVNLNVQTKFAGKQYKYILVPVYVGHYTYRKKLYNFYINGQTGRMAGKTPVSPVKVGFTIFVILAIIVGLIFLLYGG